jgi:hypothetical protein
MIDCAIRNDANPTSSPTMNASTPNTSAFAASIGIRRGAARTLARIMPVEYSLVITSAPSTQSGICARLSAAARKPVGSAA